MAKFRPAFDIWEVPEGERHSIQVGQWVFAGDPASKGRFYGSGIASDCVAWLGNARGARGGVKAYFSFMHGYGKGLRDNVKKSAKPLLPVAA